MKETDLENSGVNKMLPSEVKLRSESRGCVVFRPDRLRYEAMLLHQDRFEEAVCVCNQSIVRAIADNRTTVALPLDGLIQSQKMALLEKIQRAGWRAQTRDSERFSGHPKQIIVVSLSEPETIEI